MPRRCFIQIACLVFVFVLLLPCVTSALIIPDRSGNGHNADFAGTPVFETACVEDGRLTVRAGAGIVADSDPEKEYIETNDKLAALKKAIKRAEEGF